MEVTQFIFENSLTKKINITTALEQLMPLLILTYKLFNRQMILQKAC